MESIPIYYFGALMKGDHRCLFAPSKIEIISAPQTLFPFPWEMLYGDFCHTRKREVGEITLVQVHGWTIISFWDNTISPTFSPDVSSFLAPGFYSTTEMRELALEYFPEVYQRVLSILK